MACSGSAACSSRGQDAVARLPALSRSRPSRAWQGLRVHQRRCSQVRLSLSFSLSLSKTLLLFHPTFQPKDLVFLTLSLLAFGATIFLLVGSETIWIANGTDCVLIRLEYIKSFIYEAARFIFPSARHRHARKCIIVNHGPTFSEFESHIVEFHCSILFFIHACLFFSFLFSNFKIFSHHSLIVIMYK